VKSTLRNSPVYKFPNISVNNYDGVVQLSGFVYKEEQKAEAADLARRVPGVTEVINNVSLVPTAMGGPATREAGITSGRDTNSVPLAPRSP